MMKKEQPRTSKALWDQNQTHNPDFSNYNQTHDPDIREQNQTQDLTPVILGCPFMK